MNDSQPTATPVADEEWSGLVRDLLVFDSLPPHHPEALNQYRIAEHLQRILIYVGEACEQLDALTAYQTWRSRFHTAARATNALLEALEDRAEPVSSELLLALKPPLVAQRQAALLAQVQLQVCEGTLDSTDVQRLQYALGLADDPGDDQLHLEVGIGDPDAPVVFDGAFIVSTDRSLNQPTLDEPAFLFMPGLQGGLQKFASLHDLKRKLIFTLKVGTETALWQNVSAAQRTSAMQTPINLVTRVITLQPVLYGIHRQLKAYIGGSQVALGQSRPYEDVTIQGETLVRLNRELAQNLGVALDETRERAIDLIAEQQRTAELVVQLPAWLLNASLEVRQQYSQKLVAFHAAATQLESCLEARLPSFEAFTAQRLNTRIKQDLGLDVDADQLVIDCPKRVYRDVDIDPQFASPLHHKPWAGSEARVQSSLSELARQNFDATDEQVIARLRMMRVSYRPLPLLSGLQSITGDYLLKMIPALDIAGQYRALLRSVFRLRAPASTSDTERMLKAYELQIILDGFCARQRGLLTDTGYQLLVQAAQSRSTAQLGAAGVHISRLVFKQGEAFTGERSSRTLQGLSVIEARAGKVLIYLPQVPDGECMIEADSVQEALQRLISSLLRLPARVAWLASCVEDATEHTVAEHYIREALRRGYEGFITSVPALDLVISEQQLHVRENLLYEQSQTMARSNHDLKGEHRQRRNLIYLMFFRGLISFVPGLGVAFSVQDGWSDGHASANALSKGQLDEGLLLAGSTVLSVLDVLSSVIPVASSLGALAVVARRATRLRQAASFGQVVPSMSRRNYAIKPFAGYRASVSLLDAVPQTGLNAGTWLKDGELFIYRQGKAYRVYRRPGEQTLRLKKTATQGYEAPVRQVDGEWTYHSDVGLKGGGRSMIAEMLMVEGHASATFQRKQARELLDQFDFPSDQQQRLELLLAEHYRKSKGLPAWAEQYRRPAPAQVTPVPGKRKEPDAAHAEPDRRPRQPVAGASGPAATVDAWQGWEKHVGDMALLDQVSVNPPIYRLDFTHDYDVIRIGHKFYEILPPGGQRRTNSAFIRNPDPSAACRSYAELSEVIRRNPYEQPLMAKYQPATGQWTVEGPLLNRKIETYIDEAFPEFTDTSRVVLAQKLFEMADPSVSYMTATRMINVKAALNVWRAGGKAPLQHLNDPLLMLNKAQPGTEMAGQLRWNISYESSLHTFERLDFAARDSVAVEWLIRSVSESGPSGATHGLNGLMNHVLLRNGYEIVHERLLLQRREFIAFRRPGQDELYLLYLRRAQNSVIITTTTGAFRASSEGDGLIAPLILKHAGEPIAAILEQARQQGKIVKLVGGTNITAQSAHGTQVFVIRLPDEVIIGG